MKYQRASEEELRENGFDPDWLVDNPECEGPYAAIKTNILCPCCSNETFGWTVVNLQTATGISEEWAHDEAQFDAEEKAHELNDVWLEGYRAHVRWLA